MKTLSYSNVKYSPRVPLLLLTVEEIERENIDFIDVVVVVLLLLSFFSIKHKLKSIHHIQMICTTNECSAIKALPFLG